MAWTPEELTLRIQQLEMQIESLSQKEEARSFWDVINEKRDDPEEDPNGVPGGHEDTAPYVIGGDGVDAAKNGDTITVNAGLPHWYTHACQETPAMMQPGQLMVRRQVSDIVWENGCFYMVYDWWTVRDGIVYNIEYSCSSSIVCAEDCTELVNPFCA